MSIVPFLVIQIVIFVALVAVLRRVLSRNVTDASTRLQDLSAEYARRQEELKERLESSEQQYRDQLLRAKTESEQIISEARQEAESTKTKRIDEARLESERIVRQGMESCDALKKEFGREVDQRALERARQLLEDALPAEMRRDIQARWLEELLRDGVAQFDRLKSENGVKEVRIVTAFPLTKEQREKLRAKLKDRLAREVAVTEDVDEKLIAGLTVTAGSLVFDGSLAAKIRKAVQQAHEPT